MLERGRIVEVGGHDELIARPNGAYARLHQMQLLESKTETRELTPEGAAKSSSGVRFDIAQGKRKAESR